MADLYSLRLANADRKASFKMLALSADENTLNKQFVFNKSRIYSSYLYLAVVNLEQVGERLIISRGIKGSIESLKIIVAFDPRVFSLQNLGGLNI